MWNPTRNEWQRDGNGYPGLVLLMLPHSTKGRNGEEASLRSPAEQEQKT